MDNDKNTGISGFRDYHALLSHQIKEKTNRINDIGKKLGLRKKQQNPRDYEEIMKKQIKKGGSVMIEAKTYIPRLCHLQDRSHR